MNTLSDMIEAITSNGGKLSAQQMANHIMAIAKEREVDTFELLREWHEIAVANPTLFVMVDGDITVSVS